MNITSKPNIYVQTTANEVQKNIIYALGLENHKWQRYKKDDFIYATFNLPNFDIIVHYYIDIYDDGRIKIVSFKDESGFKELNEARKFVKKHILLSNFK